MRHGSTACSEAHRYCGHHDPPLSDLGRSQAAALTKWLAAEPIVAAYTSDLARAKETAAMALPDVAAEPEPALREIHLGDWDGLTHEEISARWPEAHATWCADRFHTPIPGGESGVALWARVETAVARIRAAHAGANVAIFSHGGPIAALRCASAGRPMAEFAWLLPELGEIVMLEVP